MSTEPTSSLSALLGVTMVAYVVVMFGIGWIARGRIETVEDYVVAGRRLGVWLATPTLLATWYGAGTLLTAADEVRARGLEASALDPLGAGVCLILAGLVVAGPMWRLGLTTLPDLFRLRFGPKAEVLAAILMIPQYFGWIAAQFLALAGILDLFFGIPATTGILLVALVGLGYTLLGGMWAVTLTDAVQLALVLLGLVVMFVTVFTQIGEGSFGRGWDSVFTAMPDERLALIPEDGARLVGWLGVLCAGALGNLPSQDLMQRVFSSRSERVAKAACLSAGVLYLVFGAIPVLLGLASSSIVGAADRSILPTLASMFLAPIPAVVFVLTIMSAVLSTIDSAILAPSTVLAQNVLSKVPRFGSDPLRLNRWAAVLVTAVSLAVAYEGESAYTLLESAYELGMVSLLVPMILGLFVPGGSSVAIIASMVSGTSVWIVHMSLGLEGFVGAEAWPVGLSCMALSLIVYRLVDALERRGPRSR